MVRLMCVLNWLHRHKVSDCFRLFQVVVDWSSCMRMFVVVAVCCPAEAAVFCSDGTVRVLHTNLVCKS